MTKKANPVSLVQSLGTLTLTMRSTLTLRRVPLSINVRTGPRWNDI